MKNKKTVRRVFLCGQFALSSPSDMKKKTEKLADNSRSKKWLIGGLVALGVVLVVFFSVMIYIIPDEQYREPAGVNVSNTDAHLNSEDPEANYFGKYAPPEERIAPPPASSDSVGRASKASSESSSTETATAEPAKPKAETAAPAASETPASKPEPQPKKQQPSGESLFD